MKFTGERFILNANVEKEIEIEHLQRYESIINLVKDKVVLDASCGSGYGTYLLSKYSKKVYGVDIDKEAINFAKENYKSDNIEYIQGSIEKLKFPNKSIEVIVSFETIEHVNEGIQKSFMKEVKRVLVDEGVLIISTPDKYIYSDLVNYNNEFHLKEFYEEEFINFVKEYFQFINKFKQDYQITSTISNEKYDKLKILNFNDNKGKYIILICSDDKNKVEENINSAILNVQSIFTNMPFSIDNYLYEIRQKYNSKLYFDIGKGFGEDLSITSIYNIKPESLDVYFDIGDIEGLKLRWDPIEGKFCDVHIKKINFITKSGTNISYDINKIKSNAVEKVDNWFRFLTKDPIFIIEEIPEYLTSISIECKINFIEYKEIEKIIKQIGNEKLERSKKIESIGKELEYARSIVEERDAQLQERSKNIKSIGKELEYARSIVKERDVQLQERSKNIESIGKELEYARSIVKERDAQLKQKCEELNRVNKKNHILEKDLCDTKQKLTEIMNMKIWRIVKLFNKNLSNKR